jgi:hypothetical protein
LPDVIFERFQWSGDNMHQARLKASEELRGWLARKREEHARRAAGGYWPGYTITRS